MHCFTAVAVVLAGTVAAIPSPEPSRPAAVRPWSVQLHVHGSFSEGVASIDSHSWEAEGVGADVIWWSDHDFRIASFHHASTFGFEDWHEPIDHDEPWSSGPIEASLLRSRHTKSLGARPIASMP